MPEAARVRTVSFRPRAPHSLRTIESTLAMASLTERDSQRHVTEIVTNVNEKVTKRIEQCPELASSFRPALHLVSWHRL
jgi:hypothetical protein